jgi:hypothetical protein
MIERLRRDARQLTDPDLTKGITVGIQTSADHIYHLKRLAKNRFVYTPRSSNNPAPIEVEIEDALMKPLVSGAEAKRFIEPNTDTFLLFPYRVEPEGVTLLTQAEMAKHFPKAWKYLKDFEIELRAREGKKFDDDKWYRMGRTQNLDKQEIPKLLVPRLVARLGCFADEKGRFYCDNVDVGGVLPARIEDIWLLAGVLNAPVTNTIFNWLSKPFRGDYRSANKQFIAPLPVPKATRSERAALSALAKGMQQRKTQQVDLRAQLEERLGATARTRWPLEKLLPDVRPVPSIEAEAPAAIKPRDRKKWVDEQRAADEEAALARIDGAVRLDSEAAVALADGKLAFLIDEAEVARVFVGQEESVLVDAQWRAVAIDFTPTGKGDAKRLIDRLRFVATTADPAVAEQIVAIGGKLQQLGEVVRDDEAQLHELTCQMFKLSNDERRLVDGGLN